MGDQAYKILHKKLGLCVDCPEPAARGYVRCEKHLTNHNFNRHKKPFQSFLPRILLLDIETSPMEVFVWGLSKNDYIPHDHIIEEWAILSWAAKWLFNSEVMSELVNYKDAKARRDKSITGKIWKLVDKADIVIAHNLKGFDKRKLNARFVVNGLLPPLPYQDIDTLRHSRSQFAFSSHKLDHLARMFLTSQKLKTEHSLWRRCVGKNGKGNTIADRKAALQEMVTYNKSDVFTLEELYLELRPWMKSHPNVGLYIDGAGTVCPNCGNSKLSWQGFYYTPAGKYQAFRCECGAIGRSRYSELDTEDRKRLSVSVAR